MVDGQKKLSPADPGDVNAKEISFMQIDQKELYIPDVSMVTWEVC